MIAWLQCTAGASGDMLVGALIDAGAPMDAVRSALDALDAPDIKSIEITTRQVVRHGIAATKADVRVPESKVRRTWPDIRAMLEGAPLRERVRERALDVFGRLAQAEAAAHGTRPSEVHFHEVGGLDAIADVVGTCAALDALDVTDVTCSPVALGTGVTRGEHGLLPVPGPAVLELLRAAGAPVYTTEVRSELCTPTGAALLAAAVTRWGGMPEVRIEATGTGAGSRDLDELPNVARVVLGEPVSTGSEPVLRVLETNVDDCDPRLWPDVLDRLLDAGAIDAWLTPILMKKGRPAQMLSALTPAGQADAVRRAIFHETSTLGIRERGVERTALERASSTVEVGGAHIRVKLAYLDGELVNAQPEYDDVARAAAKLRRPIRDVLADAVAAGKPPR